MTDQLKVHAPKCNAISQRLLDKPQVAVTVPAMSDSAKQNPVVEFVTTSGTIRFELFADTAPKTVENFVGLVKKKYYDGIVFHRVIREFMIQGGDPTGTGRGGQSIWGKPFEDECVPAVQFNRKGLLAMANAGPNTNGSQFFITTALTPWLNGRHTIFGEVVAGYETVAAIEATPTSRDDRPLTEQRIISATLVS